MVSVTISKLCVIRFWILHNALPKSALSWEFHYIYFLFRSNSATAPELYMHLYWYVCASYNGICLDMFVYVIWSNFWLHFISVLLYYISTVYGLLFHLFFHCIVVTFAFLIIFLGTLFLSLLRYVSLLHIIYSLVVLHLGYIAVNISCILFVMPLFTSSFNCIQKSILIYSCLN